VSLYGSLLFPEPLPTLTHHRFLSRLVSSTYKSPFPQLLSFLIYTKPQGCHPPAAPELCGGGSIFSFPPSFQPFANSLACSKNPSPSFSAKYELFLQNTGGGVCLRPSSEFRFSSFARLTPLFSVLPHFSPVKSFGIRSYAKSPGVASSRSNVHAIERSDPGWASRMGLRDAPPSFDLRFSSFDGWTFSRSSEARANVPSRA
jgi:hypothetical protein